MKGLVTGKTADGQYDGVANGTRAEAAAMVVRMLDKSIRKKVDTTKVITSTIEFTDAGPIAKIIGDVAFTNKVIGGEGDGEITYVSGTPKTATVDKETGKVTIVAVGTTVITASKEATKTHSAVTNSYTINVSAKDATPLTKINDIIGEAKVGVELTAGSLTPNDATVTYQWQRIWMNHRTLESIPGATSNKYTPVAGDEGWKIRVSATGSGDYSGTVTSEYTGAVATNKIAKTDPIVNKAVAATAVNAGQTLAQSTLSGTFKNVYNQDVAGTFAWNAPKTVVTVKGVFSWTFTPTDAITYNIVTGTTEVLLSKIVITDPIVNKAVAATAVNAGQTLAQSTLSGTFKNSNGQAITGTLEWQNPSLVLTSTSTNSWRLVPNDINSYNWIQGTVGVTVAASQTSDFAGGTGTVADPYKVATSEQLNNVRKYLNGYFIQTAEISLGSSPWNTGEGWIPLGTKANPFGGSYNGNGYKIYGLTINRSADQQALFGWTNSTATLANISLGDVKINCKEESGSLVGNNNGHISICNSTGSIIGSNILGGLVGYSPGGAIDYSYSKCSVEGENEVGGLVGKNGATIYACYTTGSIKDLGENGTNIGGLVGTNEGWANISKCYATGLIDGRFFIGGLVGYNDGLIVNSYSKGSAYGVDYVGGIAGCSTGTVDSSYALGRITAEGWGYSKHPAGIVGYNEGKVTNCYYDKYTTNRDDTGKGNPKTTEEMKTQSTFKNWDFVDVWNIDSNSYPYLRWQE